MGLGFQFFFNSVLFGIGLAMDAFSVSLANGLNEPKMRGGKMCGVAGMFSFFQYAMPMIGWICVSTVAQFFSVFEKCVPWIALALLLFLGIKMLIEGIRKKDSDEEKMPVGFWGLVVQGIATSIDALSVGFTIAECNWLEAGIECLIIGCVTFFICMAGIAIGKKVGTKLSRQADILGGAILIFIGLEIFITSWF